MQNEAKTPQEDSGKNDKKFLRKVKIAFETWSNLQDGKISKEDKARLKRLTLKEVSQ